MAECQQVLRAQGKAYPRTCAVCGLGPCTRKAETAQGQLEGLPVAGYRPQTSVAVDVVNRNKAAEERLLRLMDLEKTFSDVDQRWLAIARTQLEQAFMAWNRAIFRPGRVELPEDNPGLPPNGSRGE